MCSTTSRDFYDILQISRNASVQEVKLAYRTCAKLYHPDSNPSNTNTTELFQEINRAYKVLSDPLAKQQYDMYGKAGIGKSSTWDRRTPSASAQQQQNDVHHTAKRQHATESSIVGQDLRIDLNVGMIGGEKWVTIKYPQTCFSMSRGE